LRTRVAVRAVAFHLAMRAGVAVRAVVFHLVMRTPLHTHRETFTPSSRKPRTSRVVQAGAEGCEREPSRGNVRAFSAFHGFGEKLCLSRRIFAAAAAPSRHSVTRTWRLLQRARRRRRHPRRSTASSPVEVPEPEPHRTSGARAVRVQDEQEKLKEAVE